MKLSADNAAGQHASMFIDAGSINPSVKLSARELELVDSLALPTLELRFDLGAGITLTLTRH